MYQVCESGQLGDWSEELSKKEWLGSAQLEIALTDGSIDGTAGKI